MAPFLEDVNISKPVADRRSVLFILPMLETLGGCCASVVSFDSAGQSYVNDVSKPIPGSGAACAITLCGTCNSSVRDDGIGRDGWFHLAAICMGWGTV